MTASHSSSHTSLRDVSYVTILMEEQHADQVREIWSDRLGAPAEHMDAWITEVLKEGTPTEGFVASSGGTVLGYGIACLGDPDYVNNYIDHTGATVDVWPKTGVLSEIAVDREYEGRGIGSSIMETCLNWLEAEGCDGSAGVSWNRTNHVDSRVLFKKFGFTAAVELEEFYGSLDEDVYCVDCDGGCTCGATVFTHSFSGESR